VNRRKAFLGPGDFRTRIGTPSQAGGGKERGKGEGGGEGEKKGKKKKEVVEGFSDLNIKIRFSEGSPNITILAGTSRSPMSGPA